MEITINIVETATELAHKEVEKELKYDAKQIYEGVTDDESKYTDHAQKIFDENYDYFCDLLWKLKTN